MKKIILIILAIVCLANTGAEASHITGGDISYKNIGPNQFEFTLTLYRDCAGHNLLPTFKIDYSSLSCNIQGTIDVTQVAYTEISPVCLTSATTCSGGTNPGIQKYIYKGIYTLPAQCTDWVFSWRDCNRNASITNIVAPDQTCFYIEATLNNVIAPDNSSPSFLNNPVSFLCAFQGNYLNPGTVEPDGDVLTFSVVTPKTNKAGTVTYRPPYSASNPLASSPPFSINASSGDILITPTDQNTSVTAILVEERRNGVLIGSVMRDMQLISRNCNNNNPVLSGINKTLSDSISVCAGNPICFFIYGTDADNQDLDLTWNKAFDTTVAAFVVTGNVKSPKAKFCWTTKLSDVGLHTFTATLKDDFCPIYGSTTKSYKIRVHPNPLVVLPHDTVIACNATVTLSPVITLGPPPYTYKWSTGELTSSISKGQGTYSVKVTDGYGCSGTDEMNINTGILTNFSFKKLCQGQTTSFIDSSVSLAGTIVSWSWDFGDPDSGINNTSTLEDPSHTFTKNGTYNVKLTVTDDHGCTGTITKPVKFCDIPKPNFNKQDSCRFKTLPYVDLTTVTTCGIKEYIFDPGDGRGPSVILTPPNGPLPTDPFFPNNPYTFVLPDFPPVAGIFNAMLVAINENGCRDSIIKPIRIYPNPHIKILESDYFFDCSNPVKVLHSQYGGGTPPLTVRWSTGETTDNITINQAGVYSVTVTDKLGCDTTARIVVEYPVTADFDFSPYCENSDPITFTDKTFSYWGIADRRWDFGDNVTSSNANPTHLYAATNTIYYPELVVTDVTGCVSSISKKLIHILPDNNFSVVPTPLCLGQPLLFDSPRGSYIDSLIWSFGNGDSIKVDTLTMQEIYNPNRDYTYKSTYTYTSGAGNTYPVKLRMMYNGKSCIRDYAKDISIFPALNAAIDSIRGGGCKGESMRFYASQKNISSPTNTVNSWKWRFYSQAEAPPFALSLVDSSTLQNPVKVFKTYHADNNYFADLTVTNADGCELVLDKKGFHIIDLPTPYFCTENNCATQKTKFFYFCNSFPEVDIDSVSWNFGDGSPPSAVQEPFHIYSTEGIYNVRVAIFNTALGCMRDTIIPTKIYPLPVPDFSVPAVCLRSASNFTDLSIASTGNTIIAWNWNFGDGSTSSVKDPSHLYTSAGSYKVTLEVTNSISGCRDTVSKYAIVNAPPVAGFIYSPYCENSDPVTFTDTSSSGAAKASWRWEYGDNVTSNSSNPTHLYPATNTIYYPKLVVTDVNGCVDSISKKLAHILPDNNFSVLPSPLCLGQPLLFESPNGNFIDSLTWSFGNGDSLKLDTLTMQASYNPDKIYTYKSTYTYPSGAGNTYSVKLRMRYNHGCTRDYSKDITIFPALIVNIDSIRQGECSEDSMKFYASQKNISSPTNAVNSWKWKFYYQDVAPPFALIPIDSSNLRNPVKLFKTFQVDNTYSAELTVTNADGCEAVQDRKVFHIIDLPAPYFCSVNNCVTQETRFSYFCNPVDNVDIDSISWNFGDGPPASSVQQPVHIYSTEGLYNVKVSIFNKTFGCSRDTIIPTRIYPLPVPNFSGPSVCLGITSSFTDLSIASPGDSIIAWHWDFGDGGTSVLQNPSHMYGNLGTYHVKLEVTNSASGCMDTISKYTNVNPNPIAGFSTVNPNELVTGKPILFFDESMGGVRWLWNYGDGTQSIITDPLNKNPEHIYTAAQKTADVEQIVYNQYNCTDTARLNLVLNIYFVLPNAFSPNGDGVNDGFHPTYKGIEKLLEFRVYDRWGQLVFTGDGDLTSVWDGKYKGVDQPLGVYVCYAKAIAYNQQEYIYSGKVTLIR